MSLVVRIIFLFQFVNVFQSKIYFVLHPKLSRRQLGYFRNRHGGRPGESCLRSAQKWCTSSRQCKKVRSEPALQRSGHVLPVPAGRSWRDIWVRQSPSPAWPSAPLSHSFLLLPVFTAVSLSRSGCVARLRWLMGGLCASWQVASSAEQSANWKSPSSPPSSPPLGWCSDNVLSQGCGPRLENRGPVNPVFTLAGGPSICCRARKLACARGHEKSGLCHLIPIAKKSHGLKRTSFCRIVDSGHWVFLRGSLGES